MNGKPFFVFFYLFLALVTAVALPALIAQKAFEKLLIFILILSFLLILSIILLRNFTVSAKSFLIDREILSLIYTEQSEDISASDIQEIRINPYQYVFICCDKKRRLSRVRGFLKLERTVNPLIEKYAKTHGIPII